MESTPARDGAAEMTDETDADLLVYMAMADTDLDCARVAWETFYRRHVEYLYAVCLRAYGTVLGGEAGAADLVAETFKRAYEHAGTFDAAGVTDAQQQFLRTRGWLGRIAQRLAMDILRGRGGLKAHSLEADQWQQIAAEPPTPPAERDNKQIAMVRRAIESLNAKEQTVIRVTFQWYRPGEANQRLPNDICEDLATALGTTSENLRQIRRRALKKIEVFLRANAPHLAGRSKAP